MMGMAILYLLLAMNLLDSIYASETEHKTKAATEKQHNLWCYKCNNMVDGERCLDLQGNHTSMHTKCTQEQKKCKVRRVSMSTSTDEIMGKPKLWLLERNCTESCESGCIVIGERTKLHSCITCCDEYNYCNFGSGSSTLKAIFSLVTANLMVVLILIYFIAK